MQTFDIQSDASLQALNTLAVPARAAYFVAARSLQDLNAALDFARMKKLQVLALGGGSNLVFEHDHPGLVIHNQLYGKKIISETSGELLLEVASGESWSQLVEDCTGRGWYGLENLALIPGTVGAAPIQNIGAYGTELAEVFDSLDYVITGQQQNPEQHYTLRKADCEFGYRDSIFKHALSNQSFITRVRLKLSKTPQHRTLYPSLAHYLEAYQLSDTPQNVFSAVCAIRKSKLPDPALIPNSGSFFKNPLIDTNHFNQLKQRYPEAVGYRADDQKTKVAAGWLIEQTGWKGKTIDGIGMHSKQALVLVNPGERSGKAVLTIARQVIRDVQLKFNIQLEIEPRGEHGQALA